MTAPDVPEGMTFAMHGHAQRLHRRFPMCEHQDLVQEMYVWWYSHPRIVKGYLDDEDNGGHKKLSASLRNAALAWCQKEKARTSGYEVDDLYFYSVGSLRELLPAVYDPAAWERLGKQDLSKPLVSGGGETDGLDHIAAMADVSRAVQQMPAEQRGLIEATFRDDVSAEQLAARLDTSVEAARMRVQRALRRLQDELGGQRPHLEEIE